MKRDALVALLIIVTLIWVAYRTVSTAKAYDERVPTKDWCYSSISGQSIPMEYCDGLQK